MSALKVILATVFLFMLTNAAESQYLKRSLAEAKEYISETSSATAHYKAILGAGDENSGIIRGLSRYGSLVIDPGGKSSLAKYSDDEIIIFVLEGTGLLNYNKESRPVSMNDFIYVPKGTRFGFANPRESELSVLIMGFPVTTDTCKVKNEVLFANTSQVIFQTLPSHGPTTTFQLLLGTYESKRDRLAAACRVTSLFIMDFASGGTNNPHRHTDEEEVYLVLRGNGDIVAGEKEDKSEFRHPSAAGDIYFYSPKTLIGFYSGNKPEEDHARILAVRFRFP
jgi:mannose-6-phosphate isomerase-like protein (cupin superfamily)